MTADRWREVERVLEQAMDLPRAELPAFLEAHCGRDGELRREVESLLGFDHVPESKIADVVVVAAKSLDAPPAVVTNAMPERIGPYRVIREIGKGGMGTVYLVEREGEFRKQAAIKLVTLGMDTAALLHRFRLERQILATLEHPNIARLFDGGSTENGRPYLVMEYVPGVPITAYCEQKKLDTRRRIQLFRKVCSAVQYAHQNLIVHRDLKPGNILVDESGSPKLLDFGIAKLMDDGENHQTIAITGMPGLMTPDYASPEQVRGQTLTTATDVYSLGAILFELLTGVRPHRIDTYTPIAIERAVCTEEPQRPSEASQGTLKRGDLDNIVLMALEKDLQRRYASAAELSDDLGRYLDGQVVRARENTFAYRAGKFIRRNRTGVLAAGVLTALLAAGIALITIEARRAERRFQQVRGIARAVLYDIHDAVRDLPGSTKAREIVVRTSLDYLDGLRKEAGHDAALLGDTAEAYLRVGNVQGDVSGRSLGKTGEGLESIRKGLSIAEDLAKRGVETTKGALTRMRLYQAQGDILTFGGDNAAGQASYDKGVEVGEELLRREPSNQEYAKALVKVYSSIGHDGSDSARGLKTTRRAVEIMEGLAARSPVDQQTQFELAQSYGTLSFVLTQRMELAEAVDKLRKSVAIRERIVESQPNNAAYRQQLGVAYVALGDVLGNPTLPNLGDADGALAAYRKAMVIARAQSDQDPHDIRSATSVGIYLSRIGNVMPASESAGALQMFRESREILEGIARRDAKNTRVREHLASTLNNTGRRMVKSGDPGGALRAYGDAIGWAEPLARIDAKDPTSRRLLIESYSRSAEIQAGRNDRSAIEAAEKAVRLAEAHSAADPTNQASLARTPQAYAMVGGVYATLAGPGHEAEDWQRSRDWFRRSVEAWRGVASRGALTKAQAEDRRLAEAEFVRVSGN